MSKKSPQLRFEGFTDDWEERKLGEIFNYEQPTKYIVKSTEYDDNFNTPVLTAGKSFLLGYTDEISGIKNATVENPVVIFDDFTTGSHYVDFPFKIKSSAMKLLSLNDNSDNFYFMFNALKNIKYVPQSHERHWISKFSSFEIYKPSQEEQQKIGSFFKQLDATIALHQRKLDLLKEQKKGYLQKMFPKNGEKVPELRFAGFADDWEERKLGEFSDVRDGTHASPKYVSQGHPMVTSKNLTHSGLDMTDVSFLTDEDFNEINKRSKVSIGDILFGMIGTIGNPVIVDRDDFAIKNVALIKEKTSNPITNKWLLQYLKSPSFNRFIQKENAGGTQKFIALGLIRDMKLRVPEFDEQQKIGAFFKKIDETIALHQRKLDLLKEQKKGFLQNMFI